MRSIGTRLTAWYTAVLAAILATVGWGTWLALHRSVNAAADRELHARLSTVIRYLEEPAPPGAARDDRTHGLRELGEDSISAAGRGVVRVRDDGGRWVFTSPDAAEWPDQAAPARSALVFDRGMTVVVNRRRFRLLASRQPPGIVEVAVPLRPYDEVTDDFFETAAIASPLLLVSAALAGMWLSRRALRPVDAITDAARRISSTTLHARLPVPGTDDELQRLSVTLNAMLARLESEDRKARQFAADASHELRTPVAVIRATADVTMKKPRTDDEHREAWQVVQHQADRVATMVDALLRLARADEKDRPTIREPFDVAAEMRDLCDEMSVVAARAGLHLERDLPDALEYVGDPEAVKTMVAALLDNAVKYTPAGGRIVVRLADVADPPRHVMVEVADTGIGVPSDLVPFVFDRFYRVSKDRSRESGGAGLGLAIVRAIARQHGGDATMSSAAGAGCTVRVTLPHDRT